ncbi:fibronectin type-III domain-containing protein 3A isoform X2 [Anopheles aquasalis]|uniref:fibronectin type-III domain-containing protein 3A isoform X2 n=1 Tax=Anopheles aquasalis TaxID=42839 RepID=UPI00215A670C|nr:fibronectin type-III domain-containing protein 3A isoform X2 [Anopheles aquasalis]XP_050085300.1 fibronectin type-III domain-containing protein 3A isoform X2 [Anopheles aquasalis]XP_050085301.1 fibronectin type-III domain-containing protein 3A isoform X2 [Anopheles aquasalis]XP_050085302.1 fibronectin type-III domain-containing protein 3A isoform X2 [Anopheles aquasalis]XP_050085303.1 fibronectin type-III domain-containing protein 3A isoform X2 [Anopheles aquasalis]XP_050085304.1 fibronecti
MVRRAVSTSPESTNHLNHHHLSQAQTPTSSTSSLSSASDGHPTGSSQQPSPSSQQHSPVAGGGGGGGVPGGISGPGGGGAGGGPAGLLGPHQQQQQQQQHHPHQHSLHTPPPPPHHHGGGHPAHVHLAAGPPQPHDQNGHGGPPAGGGILFAAPYAGAEYYSEHSYYYAHPDYGSPPPPSQHSHICPVHDYGPVTLPMVSQNGTPPMAMPMQVPHGHMMQQIVDENGTLRHVILSTQPQQLGQAGVQHHLHPPFINGTTAPFYNSIASFQTGPGGGAPTMYPPQLLTSGGSANGGSTGTGAGAGGGGGGGGGGGAGGAGTGGGNHILHTPLQGNMTHSPSPPHTNTSYHKDERAQRQYAKMQRKLDQKQRELNATTPINSPRKHANELNGGGHILRKMHPQHHAQHLLAATNHLHVHHRNGGGNTPAGTTQGAQTSTIILNAAATAVPPPQQQPPSVIVATEEDISSSTNVAQGDEEEEDSTQSLIVEHLSAVPPPQVTEITSRSALFQWSPPTPTAVGSDSASPSLPTLPFNVQDLRYEVLLSDHGKENKYKSIFKGGSLSCKVKDLRPGQEYTVLLQVYLDQLHGTPTDATVFVTPPCEPDPPLPPKVLNRTKNTMQLRWNAAVDNGSPIMHYILEYDNGKGNGVLLGVGGQTGGRVPSYDFVEVCKTKNKQFTVSKLQPSTTYIFRLSAVNEYGRSGYSDLVKHSTVGTVPAQPAAPTLCQATATTLRLAWLRQADYDTYTLQMNDDQGYGYRNVYTGRETEYECLGLRRASTFQFRLRAENDNGRGPWSEEVLFRTLPTCPGRPTKPQVKGKVHANSFKVRWDAPHDTGGAEIMLYHLEINSSTLFERVYSGRETEALIERLNPGTAYQIRVLCEGPGGLSACSEPCLVTTEPITPSEPSKPYLKSPPTPYAACFSWDKPVYDGGAPVLEYEMEIETKGGATGSPAARSPVYRGKDMLCTAKDLQPGGQYGVQVRAINRIGAGPWSEEFRFSAGATPPDAPRDLSIAIKSPTHLTVMWTDPPTNGSPISEYILQSSADPAISADDDHHHHHHNHTLVPSSSLDANTAAAAALFHTVYRGTNRTADVRNLQPYARYNFRVCAVNGAGSSRYSAPIGQQMPAAPPNAPSISEQKIAAKSILISWQTPHDNGSPVTHYNIECGDRLITTDASSAREAAVAADKSAATSGDVEEVNATGDDEEFEEEDEEEASVGGSGAASSCEDEDEPVAHGAEQPTSNSRHAANLVDSKTLGKALAGAAGVHLSSSSATVSPAHSAKGSSGTGRDKSNSSLADLSATVNRNMLLIGELHPETTYRLRIQAINAIGTGPYSNFLKFTTAPLPPKPPKLECTQAGFAHLKLRWGEGKHLDLARYYVEMERSRTVGEFQSVYSGTRTTCKVMKLHELTSYTFRICVETRHAGKGDYSEGYTFTTTAASPNSIKAPRVCVDPAAVAAAAAASASAASTANHASLTIEWQTSRNNPFSDPIEYILQMAKAKDQDFHQAYRGPESRFTVHNLQYGMAYAFKVCPVRVRQNGDHVSGQFSPVLHHHLTHSQHAVRGGGGPAGSNHRGAMDEVDGRTLFQGNVVNSRGELILTGKSSSAAAAAASGALLMAGGQGANNNGYGYGPDGHQAGAGGGGGPGVKGSGSSAASSTLRQLQQFFEPDSSKAVAFVFLFCLLSIIVAAFLK